MVCERKCLLNWVLVPSCILAATLWSACGLLPSKTKPPTAPQNNEEPSDPSQDPQTIPGESSDPDPIPEPGPEPLVDPSTTTPNLQSTMNGAFPEANCPAIVDGAVLGEPSPTDVDGNGCTATYWMEGSYAVQGTTWTSFAAYDHLGSVPVTLFCSKDDADCPSNGGGKATRLRAAIDYSSFDLINGPDAGADPSPESLDDNKCPDCGSGFTIIALVAKNFDSATHANYLILDRQGYTQSVGPALGWSSDTKLHFGTQGKNGANKITATVAASPANPLTAPLELLIARFSRSNGLMLRTQACTISDATKTIASNNDETNTKIPALGYINAPAGSQLRLAEWRTFNRSLTDTEICSISTYLNTLYSLGMADPCDTALSACAP